MLRVHQALLILTAALWTISFFHAAHSLTGKPHGTRRAIRFGAFGWLLMLADSLGRTPVVLRAAEEAGDRTALARTAMDLVLHNAAPLLLYGAALFGRWRGWLADKVAALALVIAWAAVAVLYLIRP